MEKNHQDATNEDLEDPEPGGSDNLDYLAVSHDRDEVDILIKDPCWKKGVSFDLESLILKIYRAVKMQVIRDQGRNHYVLSIVLCNDNFIQKLNNEYRGKNAPTNCLSFPSGVDITLPQTGRPIMLGEIFIAFGTLESEAKTQNKPFKDHFTHLLVHSLLHLYGFDHEETIEAELMESTEVEILNRYFKIKNPYEISSGET